MTTDEAEYREKIRDDEKTADRIAEEAEQLVTGLENMLALNPVKRITIQTRYGSIELPIDEFWYGESTRTLHISVRTDALKTD